MVLLSHTYRIFGGTLNAMNLIVQAKREELLYALNFIRFACLMGMWYIRCIYNVCWFGSAECVFSKRRHFYGLHTEQCHSSNVKYFIYKYYSMTFHYLSKYVFFKERKSETERRKKVVYFVAAHFSFRSSSSFSLPLSRDTHSIQRVPLYGALVCVVIEQ